MSGVAADAARYNAIEDHRRREAYKSCGPVPSERRLDDPNDDGHLVYIPNEAFWPWVERAAIALCLTAPDNHSPMPCVDCLTDATSHAKRNAPAGND